MDADFVVGLLGLGEPRPPADPEGALEALRFHGLEGLAVARHRAGGGRLLGSDLLDELEPAYRAQALATTLTLESAERARAVLSGASIPSLLFKGAALVRDGTYEDPGARRMDDADLLVRPADAEVAVAALIEAGFAPVTGWDPGRLDCLEEVTLHDTEAPRGASTAVDVHWRTEYDRLRFGGTRESHLWLGVDLERGHPCPETHLTVVAEHLLKHLRFKVHLTAYGDLARLAGQVRDWDLVERVLAGSRLTRGVRSLLRALADGLGVRVPESVLRRSSSNLAKRLSPRVLVGRRRTVRGRISGLAQRWRMLGTPGRVLADLHDAALPSAAWLRARYGSAGPTTRLRYVRDVLRWSMYRGRSPASPNQELFEATARE